MEIRHDWKYDEVSALYDMPLLDLVYKAAGVHRQFHDSKQVQISSLVSISHRITGIINFWFNEYNNMKVYMLKFEFM